MDFGTLLYEAQKNERSAESRPNYYKTKFSPPKKVSKDRSKLSINVQKFLEKQNEDEKKKKEDDKKKLNELLILRNQDKKSVNRVNKMLKLTKSANKSVLDDEPEEMMADSSPSKKSKGGSFQPDEDDYGYTSQAASSLYDKLMDKYSAMPDSTPGFLKPKKSSVKNISDIKDRVKAALRKEEEEKLLPHKRKRKHKDSEGDHEERHRSDDEERDKRHDKHRESERDRERNGEREKAKKKPMPPPMDFNELLKLAEKKQHEPVVVEKKEDKERKKEKDREPERLMTKKERREYEAHVERRRRLMEQERDFEKQEKGKDTRGGGGGFKIPKKNKEGEKRSENEDIDKRSLEKTSHNSSSSSSSSNSKALSREELVDKLKKPSSVWSAPCNLTPPKLKAKYPNSSSSTHGNSFQSRNSNDSPVRNGYHGSSNRHSSSERTSSSSSARKLPFKESSYSSKSDKYDKYRENSHRDRDDSRGNDRNRERTRENSRGDSRDRERTKEKSRGGEKSRADVERELLLEQFKIQQEAMKRLEEKLKQMEKRDVPSNSDDRRRKRSESPRYSEKKSSSDKYETSSDRYDKASDKRLSDREKFTEKRHSSDRIPSKDKPRMNGERDRERLASSSSVSKLNSTNRTPSKPSPDVRKDSGSGDRKVNGASSEHKNGQISTPEKGKTRPTLNGRLKEDLMRQPPKQFPPPDMMKPKQFPPADVRRGPKKPVKRRIESDSEYDSELDDFIVDDNDAELDISQEISNIFGYDRRKYSKYDEEDDVAMESNFHRMEKEEYESTKAGILEDLEDIAKEKRLKALAAKRKALKVKR